MVCANLQRDWRVDTQMTVRVDLLKTLADHLDTVDRKQFDIDVWREDTECGYVACAIGHAVGLPGFGGLKIKTWGGAAPLYFPAYKNLEGLSAVMALFDIDQYDAEQMFTEDGYERPSPTPKMVARKIRKFVKDSGK